MGEEKQSEFERGAVWVMTLIQRQLTERQVAIRKMNAAVDTDVGGVLSGVSNVLSGVRAQLEIEVMKTLRKAEARHG